MKAARKSNKKIVLTAAVVIVLAVVVIVVALKQMKARRLAEQLDLGAKYLSMMEYERAMDAYLDAIEIEPECVEAYFGLAAVYYETGKIGKAEAVMSEGSLYEMFEVRGGTDDSTIAGIKDKSLRIVVVPERINGTSIKKIDRYAFNGCSNMTKVIILDGITEISDEAFFFCKSLTDVTIPNSVTMTGWGVSEPGIFTMGVFWSCDSLTTIHTPRGSYAEQWAWENGYEVVNIMP